LTVDTGFTTGGGTIKAYVTNNLSLGDRQIAAQFQDIPLDLRMVEAERVGCKHLSTDWTLFIITLFLLFFLLIDLFV
jgi:translation initiation factor 3 subunit F